MVLAYTSARSEALASFSRPIGSFLRSSVHISWVLPSALPKITLGVPSIGFYSRLRYSSRSFYDLIVMRWQILSDAFINKNNVKTVESKNHSNPNDFDLRWSQLCSKDFSEYNPKNMTFICNVKSDSIRNLSTCKEAESFG